MRGLVIIGAGGFGREVFAIVSTMTSQGERWVVEGFADDSPSASDSDRVRALGSEVLGTVADVASRTEPFGAVIAVGSPEARAAISVALAHSNASYPPLIHPSATIGPEVALAEGVVVAAGARLSTNISVGRHVHVDQNVTVGHDSVLEDFCRLNPQSCISGSVRVGVGAVIGASATILQGLTISNGATVGAGAVVVRDVPPDAVVKGVPAR